MNFQTDKQKTPLGRGLNPLTPLGPSMGYICFCLPCMFGSFLSELDRGISRAKCNVWGTELYDIGFGHAFHYNASLLSLMI